MDVDKNDERYLRDTLFLADTADFFRLKISMPNTH